MTDEPTTLVLPDAWQRAIDRAEADALRPIKLDDETYLVASTSQGGGASRRVKVLNGKIVFCDCPGWRGRKKPCKHAASVALVLLALN